MSTTRTARTRTIRLLAAMSTMMLAASLATPALAHDDAPQASSRSGQALGRLTPGLGAELARVRAATARYHDVEVALADGFVLPEDHCVAGPDGAMGYHYVHFGRVGQLDPALPQVLLYAPGHDGQLRLVGVEYLSPIGGEVLGRPLADFSPPFGPDTALHVWLWQANPAGMFASYNPNLSCRAT